MVGPLTFRVVVLLAGLGSGTAVLASLDQARQRAESAALTVLNTYERTGTTGPATFQDANELIRALDAVVDRWAEERPDATNRRRQLAALLPLEIIWSHRHRPLTDDLDLLRWGRAAARRTASPDFERRWLLISIGILQKGPEFHAQGASPRVREHLEYARDRFPNEPRVRLALLLARPESVVVSSRTGAPAEVIATPPNLRRWPDRQLSARQADLTLAAFDALATDPEVGSEARTHAGILKFHRGRFADAVADLEAAARATADPFVRNLSWLNAAMALDALERPDDALVALRAAHDAMPESRTSAIALAGRLFLTGRRAEASRLLDRALAGDPIEVDPWLQVAGDLRFGEAHLSALRGAAGLPPVPRSAANPAAPSDASDSAPVPTPARPTPQPVQAPSTFRSAARGVAVDVGVFAGGNAVRDLAAAEFAVFDNGVRQLVDDLSREAVPLDVSVIVAFDEFGTDVSRARAAQLSRDLASVAQSLAEGDRLRVVVVASTPLQLVPLQRRPIVPSEIMLPSRELMPLAQLSYAKAGMSSYGRSAALYDSVASALMRTTPPDRRHLVIVFTNGVDNESVLGPAVFERVTAMADALLYVFRNKTHDEIALERSGRRLPRSSYGAHLWLPEPQRVVEAARVTGGREIFDGGVAPMADDVADILAGFRQRYVLRYQPTGVPPEGWHKLTVHVTRPGKYDVQARRGYFGG